MRSLLDHALVGKDVMVVFFHDLWMGLEVKQFPLIPYNNFDTILQNEQFPFLRVFQA